MDYRDIDPWSRSRVRSIDVKTPEEKTWIYIEWPEGMVEGWLDSTTFVDYEFYEHTDRYRNGPSVTYAFNPTRTIFTIEGVDHTFDMPGKRFITRVGKDSHEDSKDN